MSSKINRRDFLKIMGWSGVGAALAGCDMPSYVTLEEGRETVTSYVHPEEFVIPGIAVYYASTCQQCPAGCGVHARVREGRVLKVEGNPASPINRGKLCQMGQAGLQQHYNPDRLSRPLLRSGGRLQEVSWEQAEKVLLQRLGGAAQVKEGRVAWLTGALSGHQAVLLDALLESLGSPDGHYVHEVINDEVVREVNRELLGEAQPRYDFGRAKMILSFGADFLGASASPVHFATEFGGRFRGVWNDPEAFKRGEFLPKRDRGVLVQAEPAMSLTGANADLWLAVRPGTEGALALGIANTLLVKHRRDASMLPEEVRRQIARYDLDTVSGITGVAGELIVRTAAWLNERSPSLVLAGGPATGQEHGYQAAAAAMLLNLILGNVGQTILPSGDFPFAQLAPRTGGTRGLLAFTEKAAQGAVDVAVVSGSNPAYTAPAFVGFAEAFGKVPFKVVLTQFPDETAQLADLVLPLRSPYEDWGTHVAAYQAAEAVIGIQQPVMTPLYEETRGLGDILLTLLKARKVKGYEGFADYYAYLRSAFAALPAELKGGLGDEAFWQRALQDGQIRVPRRPGRLQAKAVAVELPEPKADAEFPFRLVPSARLGLWDGRHANIPWLQEAPDQITKVVWGSWAELHPRTAQRLGVEEGDVIRITSPQGAIEARVYVYKGVHPEAVAVPMGQGHEAYGRYAQGRGVNPLKILAPVREGRTGELALYGTRVQIAKVGRKERLVRMGGTETQQGRKLVATVTAEVYRRSEGGGEHVA